MRSRAASSSLPWMASAVNRPALSRSRLVVHGVGGRGGAAGRAGLAQPGRFGEVERHTDELAAAPYRALGARSTGRLAQLAGPVTMAVVGTGMLPRQSTLGINRT